VGSAQERVLRELKKGDMLTVNELAKLTKLNRFATRQALYNLERWGEVERVFHYGHTYWRCKNACDRKNRERRIE